MRIINMTLRKLGSLFIFLYGFSLPVLAFDFMEEYFWASIAMILCCLVIAFLLLFKICDIFNLILSYTTFKIYLIRPYVDVFTEELADTELAYIDINNWFFNASDATVVYFSILLSLCAWMVGLIISLRLYPCPSASKLPVIFERFDRLVANSGWRFWLVWLLLICLNYVPAAESWRGIAGGESATLFAYGLTDLSTISVICLFTFLKFRAIGDNRISWLLILPALYALILGTVSGGRSSVYEVLLLSTLYLVYLNYDQRIRMKSFWVAATLFVCLPFVLFAGLVAQSIKPLLRTKNIDNVQVLETFFRNLNIFDPDNMIFKQLYFGITEILHRFSALEAQFMIFNDRFINSSWDNFNPLTSLMRLVNDLIPGSLFPDMLTINQLFSYIYYNEFVTYRADMWGFQSTLYLYFGSLGSAIIVLLLALFVSRYWFNIKSSLNKSPSYLTFMIILTMAIIENGTIERIIPVNVIRPLASIFIMTFLVRLLYSLVPIRKKF